MTTRVLPRAEWPRLEGTELGLAWPYLPAGDETHVLVVEDHHGQIVACWAAIHYWHLEGLWVHPEHRGKAGVGRRIWRQMFALLRTLGVRAALTAAMTGEVREVIVRLNGQQLPGEHFVLPIPQGVK